VRLAGLLRALPAAILTAASIAACSSQAPPSVESGGPAARPSGARSSPAATPQPSSGLTGLKGTIAFSRAGDSFGEGTIFLASIDGSNERQLTRRGDSGGLWAARDGSRIVYFGVTSDDRGSAVVANGDGSNPKLLELPEGTLNLGTGPFAPDGSRVLREGFDDARTDVAGIYVSDVDGGNVVRLTTRHFIPADWSPDGRHLLLFDNEAPTSEPPAPGKLYISNADGSEPTQLTPDGVLVACCGTSRWSPDGSKIVFATQDGMIHTIAPDGSELRDVFKDRDGRFAIGPTWSPDGSMILFGLDPVANSFSHPPNALVVIRSDGTGLTELIGGNDFKREAAWMPR